MLTEADAARNAEVEFTCPLSLHLFLDPVTVGADADGGPPKQKYERYMIRKWLEERGNHSQCNANEFRSPLTNECLPREPLHSASTEFMARLSQFVDEGNRQADQFVPPPLMEITAGAELVAKFVNKFRLGYLIDPPHLDVATKAVNWALMCERRNMAEELFGDRAVARFIAHRFAPNRYVTDALVSEVNAELEAGVTAEYLNDAVNALLRAVVEDVPRWAAHLAAWVDPRARYDARVRAEADQLPKIAVLADAAEAPLGTSSTIANIGLYEHPIPFYADLEDLEDLEYLGGEDEDEEGDANRHWRETRRAEIAARNERRARGEVELDELTDVERRLVALALFYGREGASLIAQGRTPENLGDPTVHELIDVVQTDFLDGRHAASRDGAMRAAARERANLVFERFGFHPPPSRRPVGGRRRGRKAVAAAVRASATTRKKKQRPPPRKAKRTGGGTTRRFLHR